MSLASVRDVGSQQSGSSITFASASMRTGRRTGTRRHVHPRRWLGHHDHGRRTVEQRSRIRRTGHWVGAGCEHALVPSSKALRRHGCRCDAFAIVRAQHVLVRIICDSGAVSSSAGSRLRALGGADSAARCLIDEQHCVRILIVGVHERCLRSASASPDVTMLAVDRSCKDGSSMVARKGAAGSWAG
jgi:hypothetical protein